MKKSFRYFTLSIFKNCNELSLTKAISNDEYIKSAVRNGYASIFKESLSISQYFNAPVGGRYERFSWWNNTQYLETVFLTSNLSNGLDSLSRHFRAKLKCNLINICISIEEDYKTGDFQWFQYIKPNGEERLIYANKEDRWIFYEEGEPLPFENKEYYKRRLIKDRLNNDIIVEYLSKMGINLLDIDKDVANCMTFERTAWE